MIDGSSLSSDVSAGGLKILGSLKKVTLMTQLVITFISSKYYIMYLFLRRFVCFRLWPGALLISHTVKNWEMSGEGVENLVRFLESRVGKYLFEIGITLSQYHQ